MLEELRKVIDQNLPREQGELLRKRLDELAALESQVALLNKDVDELLSQRDVLKDKLARHHNLDVKLRELEAARTDQLELERKNESIRTQAECSELRRADAFDLVSLIFRSPVIKETIERSGNKPISVGNGCVQDGWINETENKTTETT